MDGVKRDTEAEFLLSDDGVLKFRNKLCFPKVGDLRREILEESHNSKFLVHLGGNKMYRDMIYLY